MGHVPIEISRLTHHFLNESTENCFEGMVIEKRTREIDLVAPVEYNATTKDKMTATIFLSELKKRKEKYKHFNLEIVNNEQSCCKTPLFIKKNSLCVNNFYFIPNDHPL